MAPVSVHGIQLDVSGFPTLSLSLTSSVRHPQQEWMKRTLGLTPQSICGLCHGGRGRRGLRATCKIKQKATVEMQRNPTKIWYSATNYIYKYIKKKIHIEVTRCMWEWCAGVHAKECIIPEVSPTFNDDEYVCRPTVAEQTQQQAYFQPCKSNYLKSAFPKSVCNTHEACLCINLPPTFLFTIFTIRSSITVIRLGLRICDWSIKYAVINSLFPQRLSCRAVTFLGSEGDCSGLQTHGPPLLIPTAHICETQSRSVHIWSQWRSQAESRGPEVKQAQLDGPAQCEEN